MKLIPKQKKFADEYIKIGKATQSTIEVGYGKKTATVKKEVEIKTRIAALKEILKRYPGNDELVEQQVRKMKADVDMVGAKAKLMNNDRVSLETKILSREYDDE